jgi:hypothetical protein
MSNDADDFSYELAPDDNPPPKTQRPKRRRPAPEETAGSGSAKTKDFRRMEAERFAKQAESKKKYKEAVEAEEARKEWLIPAILIAAVGLLYIVGFVIGQGAVGIITGTITFAIIGIFTAILAISAAFAAATVFGIGFGGTVVGTFLRLTASALVSSLLLLLPGCIGLGAYVSMLVIMLVVLLDMDGFEAQLFTLVFVVAQLLMMAGLVAGLTYLGSLL